jgi:hypothetical protein
MESPQILLSSSAKSKWQIRAIQIQVTVKLHSAVCRTSLCHEKAHLWVGFVLDRGRIKELRGVSRVPILILGREVDTAQARRNVVTQCKSLFRCLKGLELQPHRRLELSHLPRVANLVG